MPPASLRKVQLSPEQELKRGISVDQAAEIKGISPDSFRRHYAHLIEKVTPRREIVRLGKALD
jgi:hypothetical protein